MITITGKSVCEGIALGRLCLYQKTRQDVQRRSIADTSAELALWEAAKTQALTHLAVMYDKALQDVGESEAMIFDVHQMMLQDMDYNDAITSTITTERVNAEYAVWHSSTIFAQMFADMDDPYMQARAADVQDISQLLVGLLRGDQLQAAQTNQPSVLAADDLSPSETLKMDKSAILAFVTRQGSLFSHTAIIAKTMNIPAIIGVGEALLDAYHDRLVIVDGFTGTVTIDPDALTLAAAQKKQQQILEHRALLERLKGLPSVTLDGQSMEVAANIGNLADLELALRNDAEGVGLFRSEFLYLEARDYPSEEVQFAAYKKLAQAASGKRVIIRTLDIGADKAVDYFQLPPEVNPALGFRAIRICLQRPDMFKVQLRAIFRASAFGRVAIMFPMIISHGEILTIKQLVEEVRRELAVEGKAYAAAVELGIMIETPAAALLSDVLAKEVDFFSIGTNDLTQYTLALDRQNALLDTFCDPHHPALLRLIKLVVDNAHANGIWVGICGEMAADSTLTPIFLALGVDELSVAPSSVLRIRESIRTAHVGNILQERPEILHF